uniref:Rho GTPase-activating protein 7 isoform X2 n=1 Tax=Rhizophora mucronata TaxID=61149 RepID=A0A2P2MTH7_RHIMU
MNGIKVPNVLSGESYRSMGEILSTMDPIHPLPISGLQSSAEKTGNKTTASNSNGKRSAFWGRSNVSHS